MQQTQLTIKGRNKDNIYFINTKSDLQSETMQRILSVNHSLKITNKTIRCGCVGDDGSPLYLANKKAPKTNQYYLSLYPNSFAHSSECCFCKENELFMDTNDGVSEYNSKIFLEVDTSNNKSTLKGDLNVEKAKANTFVSFCLDLITMTMKDTYKEISKKDDKKYDFSLFCKKYKRNLLNMKIKGNKNIYDIMNSNEGYYFSNGIIESPFDNNVTNRLSENIEVSNDELETLTTIELRSIYWNNVNNCYNLSSPKLYSIELRRLLLSFKNVQIFKNHIQPPYFYNLVMYYGKIVRLHIYPIYFSETENVITFVESDYERKYAQKLHTENVEFIKPINGFEFDELYPKYPHFKFRPDFILLNSSNTTIVEVSGFEKDETYQKHLLVKEKYYNYLAQNTNHNPPLTYKKVIGKNLIN